MGFFDSFNPIKAISNVASAIGNAVKSVAEGIGDALKAIVETAANIGKKLAEAWANGITEFARTLLEGAKWVMDVAADVLGLGKDGWLTDFLTKHIPFAGIVASAVHAIRGNKHHAEYAAAQGLATGVEAVAVAAGSFGGPVGGMLGGAIGAAARHGIQAGLRGELDPSVRNKMPEFDLGDMMTDVTLGAALGGAGGSAATKAKKASAASRGLRSAGRRLGPGAVGTFVRKQAASQAAKATAHRAAQRAARQGASQATKDVARKLGVKTATNLTAKNLGKSVLYGVPKRALVGGGKEIRDGRTPRSTDGATPPPPPTPRPGSWGPRVNPVAYPVAVLILVIGPVLTVLVLIFSPTSGGGATVVTVALPPRVVQAALPPAGLALPPRAAADGDPSTGGTGPTTPQPPATTGAPQGDGDAPTTTGTTPPASDPAAPPTGSDPPGAVDPGPVTPTEEPTQPATPPVPSPSPSAVPPPPPVADWTLVLTTGSEEWFTNQPFRLRFGIDTQRVTTGSVYEPYLEDTLTTSGIVEDVGEGPEAAMEADGTTPETGTFYLYGYVLDGATRVEGLYGYYYVQDGQENYYEGEFVLTRGG